MGFWLALHDADEGNGCLWARPGSQHEPILKLFARSADASAAGNATMVFEPLVGPNAKVSGEWADRAAALERGVSPRDLGFVPIPAKAGDLVVISGAVDHMSLPNRSERARHTFQLHLVDGDDSVEWAPSNWLQYPGGLALPSLRGLRELDGLRLGKIDVKEL